jgi:outer membrane lipoprotein carrier protein
MKQIIWLWTLALLLVLPLNGEAEAARVGMSDVIQALERPFQSTTPAHEAIHDFQGDFFQESRLASLDQMQRGRGLVTVRFDQRGPRQVPRTMFRWQYSQPTTQEIVSDGEVLYVYLPENRQVIQSNIELSSQARQDDPMTFLTGLGNLSRDFLITWAEPNQDVEGNYVLKLRPRRTSSLIREMLIVVDRDAVDEFVRSGRTGRVFPILSTNVIDPNDNSTLIEFSDLRINRGASDFDFRFIVPAGVEVVRPTGQEMGF